jgi:hypothetical protein
MTTTIATISPVSYLRDEYQRQGALFDAQPTLVQRFIESQAQRLAEAIVNDAHQVRFALPDRVVTQMSPVSELAAMLVPAEVREQTVGGWRMRSRGQALRELVRLSLSQLEQSPDQAVSSSAALLRYATAIHMVYNLLPAGRAVTYRADGDEAIPSIPVKSAGEPDSAITSAADAIVEQHPAESGRGELLVPFVPAARRFYLPQWVAFDDAGNLLVNSVSAAEANQASMERYLAILHAASSLAPYLLADETYQHKRYGMLGQAVNQGRALARYKTAQIIQTIRQRVEKGTLNRGLSILLPYYDDQELRMRGTSVEIIPGGRIAFKPVFVARAARLEHAKVSQDTRLNVSTRKHLLHELDCLEQAFVHSYEQVR